MTKRIAAEGTAIIAREFTDRLAGKGVPAAMIQRATGFLSLISILEEARIAADAEGVSAMHDVTEGGLATAMEEFAAAGGHRFRVRIDQIPLFPETEKICRATGIDPMGLIGSGSLLITCRSSQTEALVAGIRGAGIEATVVGEVLGPGRGIEAADDCGPAVWPAFDTDELTRLF
jgi:hydrogenase maturation factor